jgi:hypothetical protein
MGQFRARWEEREYYNFLTKHRRRPQDPDDQYHRISDDLLRDTIWRARGQWFRESAEVCDKRRLFLQRERKFKRAALHGMQSYGLYMLMWSVEALADPSLRDDLDKMLQEERVLAEAEKLTKKVDVEGVAPRITDALLAWAADLPKAREVDLVRRLREALE